MKLLPALLLASISIANSLEEHPDSPSPFNASHVVTIQGATQPHLTIDPSGTTHLVCAVSDSGSMYYLSSKNGGTSFSSPTLIAQVPGLMVGMRAGPRVAVTKTSIIVMAGGGPSKNFMAWRSTDDGKTWSKPITLNTVESPGNEGLHDLAAHQSTALAVWLDMRDGIARLYSARSTDDSQTWSEQLIYQSPSGHICECCHPSVTFAPDGTAHIMWRNYLKGMRDMFLISSKDGGKTWDKEIKLGEGRWPLEACPMAGGAIAALVNNPPVTIWRRKDTIFLSEPGKPEVSLGKGSDPWIASGPSGWYAVWKNPEGEIIYSSDQDTGMNFAQSLPAKTWTAYIVTREGNYPVVTGLANGPVIAAWETEEGIFAARIDNPKEKK